MSSRIGSNSVEHLAFLSMFASAFLEPVSQHYIYRRLLNDSEQSSIGNSSQSYENHTCSTRPEIENDEAFREAFNWFLYVQLATAMSALCITPFLGSWSDKIGRRVAFLAPSCGAIIQATMCIIIFKFKLQFELLLVGSLICGIAGYTTTFNAACLAYVSDITSKSQRTLRVVVVNTAFGIGSGLAGFLSIYLLKYDGHSGSLWLVLGLQLFIVFYVILFLKETIIHDVRPPLFKCKHFLNMFTVFYQEPGNERRWRLLTYTVAFALSEVVISGTNKFLQYYAFLWPLCFSQVHVGYLAGALSLCFLSSLIGVWFLQKLPCCTNNWIIEVGFLSYSGGLLLAAFASTPLMLFLVPVVQVLGLMPLSVLRACLSKLVDQEEQGALFAAVGCIESVALFVGATLFNAIYKANIPTMSGFPFIIGATLLLVPAFLVGIVLFQENPTSYQLFLKTSRSADNEYWRQCSISDTSPILSVLSQSAQENYQTFDS